MLDFIHGLTTEALQRYIRKGVIAYVFCHTVLLFIVQFKILDYFAVNVLQTLFSLFFLFLIVSGLVSGQVKFHKRQFVPVLLLLLTVWGVLSTCFAEDKDIALYGADTRNEGLFAWLFYYLLCYVVSLLSEKDKRKCIYSVSFAGILCLSAGIVGALSGLGLIYSKRAMACIPFLHHNMYSGFAVMFFALHLAWAFFGERKKERIYATLASVVSIAALVYATSSSGHLTAFFVVVVLLVMCLLFDRRNKAVSWKRLCLLLVLSVGIAAICVPLVNYTVDDLLKKDAMQNEAMVEEQGANGVLNGRLDHWIAGFRALPDYWLTGVGIDNYSVINKNYGGDVTYSVSTAHNEYIQLALTEGVPALVLYLALLFLVFFAGIRNWKKPDKKEPWLQRGLFLAFMAYICQAFVSFSSVAVTPFFWMFMGMLRQEKN